MKLILLGAPGAGKGTQAEVISNKYNIPSISTGNILREAIKKGTELGLTAKSFLDDGKLVPDDVVIALLKERLRKGDCVNGYILDGFPRTVNQAIELDNMKVLISKVLDIEVLDTDILTRLSGRRVCSLCGSSYHILYKPSKVQDVCDVCQGELIIRDDDKIETIKKRLTVYHEMTEPLKEYYSKKNLLYTIKGQEEVADTTAITLKILEA